MNEVKLGHHCEKEPKIEYVCPQGLQEHSINTDQMLSMQAELISPKKIALTWYKAVFFFRKCQLSTEKYIPSERQIAIRNYSAKMGTN